MLRQFQSYACFFAVDSFEPKSIVTRKLRRRNCDPLPPVEKRRKVAPLSSLVYVLEENEMDEDVKAICKVCWFVFVVVVLINTFLCRARLPVPQRILHQVCHLYNNFYKGHTFISY